MTESTSAELRKTPPMGESVGSSGAGASCGVASICERRSGEAPSRNHTWPSGEKANCVWDRGEAWRVPARSPEQFWQPQFHCGKPPPAAEPRTLICMAREDDSEKAEG